MSAPRSILLLGVTLVLGLLVVVVVLFPGAQRSSSAQAAAARSETVPRAADEAAGPPSETFRLELPGENSLGRDGAARSLSTTVDLEVKFEKRYRGFTPGQLSLAHEKLCEVLRRQVDDLIRKRLKSGESRPHVASLGSSPAEGAGSEPSREPGAESELGKAILVFTATDSDGKVTTRIAEIDVEHEEATSELYHEIAWLAARMPRIEVNK